MMTKYTYIQTPSVGSIQCKWSFSLLPPWWTSWRGENTPASCHQHPFFLYSWVTGLYSHPIRNNIRQWVVPAQKKEREREWEEKRETESDRDTDRKTDRQTDRQKRERTEKRRERERSVDWYCTKRLNIKCTLIICSEYICTYGRVRLLLWSNWCLCRLWAQWLVACRSHWLLEAD